MMMKIIHKMIPTIFLLAVSVSMVAAINLNQILAQNPSNPNPTVLKGAISALQITVTQQNRHGY